MYCTSCRKTFWSGDEGTCRNCYLKAEETFAELQREIEDLKAKIAFLRSLSPLDHSDVLLIAASEDGSSRFAVPVRAHKAVLVSRSPVFKAMLENEMEEKRSGNIKINDVSYDALCAFINYFYTAETSLEEEMASELLELAEKYQVKHLKSYCENFLVSKLNWDNSIMIYVFARQHNALHLRKAALSLIIDNMTSFIQRHEYMELVEKDPHLVVEIYEAYLSEQINIAAPKIYRTL